MPVNMQIPDAALPTVALPLTWAAVAWAPNSVLGFPASIPAAPRTDSNAILVAGFNGFLFIFTLNADFSGADMFVSYCDPTTDAVLRTELVGTGAAGSTSVIPFGAFAAIIGPDFTAIDWYVIRIGLQGNPAAAQVDEAMLFAGTR